MNIKVNLIILSRSDLKIYLDLKIKSRFLNLLKNCDIRGYTNRSKTKMGIAFS